MIVNQTLKTDFVGRALRLPRVRPGKVAAATACPTTTEQNSP